MAHNCCIVTRSNVSTCRFAFNASRQTAHPITKLFSTSPLRTANNSQAPHRKPQKHLKSTKTLASEAIKRAKASLPASPIQASRIPFDAPRKNTNMRERSKLDETTTTNPYEGIWVGRIGRRFFPSAQRAADRTKSRLMARGMSEEEADAKQARGEMKMVGAAVVLAIVSVYFVPLPF